MTCLVTQPQSDVTKKWKHCSDFSRQEDGQTRCKPPSSCCERILFPARLIHELLPINCKLSLLVLCCAELGRSSSFQFCLSKGAAVEVRRCNVLFCVPRLVQTRPFEHAIARANIVRCCFFLVCGQFLGATDSQFCDRFPLCDFSFSISPPPKKLTYSWYRNPSL